MRFDFVDLKLIEIISETRNMTRAAEHSNLSLSAASTRIRNLEESIGSKLFYRHNLGVTLTPQGETFLQHAKLILHQYEMFNRDMQEYSLGMSGRIRISADANASATFLPSVLYRYLEKNPKVSILLKEQISQCIVEEVSNGRADIGIISNGYHTKNLAVLEYHSDPIVLAVPLNHPLSCRSVIALEDTLEHDFVGTLGDSLMIPNAAETSKRFRIRIQCENYETTCRLIEARIGIGVIPESTAKRHAAQLALKIIPLSNEWASTKLRICVRDIDSMPKFARYLVDLMSRDAHHRQMRFTVSADSAEAQTQNSYLSAAAEVVRANHDSEALVAI